MQNGVGTQGVGKFKYRNVVANSCEVDGRFDTRIATANHGHVLTFIERTIAMGAEMHALTHVFGFIVYVQTSPAGTCGHHNSRRNEHFSTLSVYAFG